MTDGLKTWPVILSDMPDGRLLVRWFAGRRQARQVMKRRGRDDVMSVDLDGMRLEVSFHDNPADADAAAQSTWDDLKLAAAPAGGRA